MKAYLVKLGAALALAALLGGCSTTDTKEGEGGAAVGDGAGGYGDGSDRYGSSSRGLGDGPGGGRWGAGGAGGALDDPNSPLSKRVIYFDFDSSEIRSDSQTILRAHGRYLSATNQARVNLQGQTDEQGTREYNLALGERRAMSVKRFLMAEGASERQMDALSYGEESPAESGHSESAWSKNRRVELVY